MKYDLKVTDSFGKRLEVRQEIPDKGEKFPTVILVPGFGMDLHEYGYFDDITMLLVRHGFQVVSFSFEGSGNSAGDFTQMTLDSQVQQLKDIIEYVKKDRFTKLDKIGLLGQSFGATVIITGLPISEIKTIIFTSAPIYPGESLAKRLKRQRSYNPEGISKLLRSDNRETKIGPAIWENLEKYDFVKSIRKVTQPILFIYGSKDRSIKYADMDKFFNSVSGKKKIHIIDQGDHGFTAKFRPKVLELIVQWFEETLR